MKKLLTMISAAFAVHAAFGGDYPYSSAALTNVTVTGGFWLPRFETNRLVTLKADFEKCELERIPNSRRAAAHEWGTFKGVRFDDSDVFKVIEGAAYTLAIHPDPELEKYVDGVIVAIAGAQEPTAGLWRRSAQAVKEGFAITSCVNKENKNEEKK